jgi:xanthine dehydrogenase YagR molybdenum-binding subunit
MSSLPLVGAPRDRLDGPAKVTGKAMYAADFAPENLAHAVIVTSKIACGRVARVEETRALGTEGVIAVLTHRNAPRVRAASAFGYELTLLQDDRVRYDRQPVALVIAETLERAVEAAAAIEIEYESEAPVSRIEDSRDRYTPEDIFGDPSDATRGDPERALASAPIRLSQTYTTPVEHHNPMEPHAAVAHWDGDRLTVHDSTQGVTNVRRRLAEIFDLPAERVHVLSPYMGGGFGCKGGVWSHVALAAMAARIAKRPVKLALSRPQMFSSVGHRPRTVQDVSLGADSTGKLLAITHDVLAHTSVFDEFIESSALLTRMLYAVPNLRTTHKLARLNVATPTYMRAPGESSGSFALESAMDELACELHIDPIELRLRNHADKDPEDGRAFSSKHLRECYAIGAKAIGWNARRATPRSNRNGRMLVGLGMASASYPAFRWPASAEVRIEKDGGVIVSTGTQDLGTGSYTVYAQIAAEVLGIPLERVRVELGDTDLPKAPLSVGSVTAASVGTVVHEAAVELRKRLERGERPPFGSQASSKPPEEQPYSTHSFGANFARVEVDPELGIVRVLKMVGAFACGRILNRKTARSQFLGGMVWGAGMALHEITRFDDRTARIMNANLSDYLVPVNADLGEMEAYIVEETDAHVNPIGVKGVGEIGIVGAAAAIANAVYNATDIRIRDLPITPEKLLPTAASSLPR